MRKNITFGIVFCFFYWGQNFLYVCLENVENLNSVTKFSNNGLSSLREHQLHLKNDLKRETEDDCDWQSINLQKKIVLSKRSKIPKPKSSPHKPTNKKINVEEKSDESEKNKNFESAIVESGTDIKALITEEDVASLGRFRWLSSLAIDFCVLEIIDENKKLSGNDYYYVMSQIGTEFFENNTNIQPYWEVNKVRLNGKKIIIPVNIGQTHWCLIIVNTLMKTIEYYDPADPKPKLKWITVKHRLINFLIQRNQYVPDEEIDITLTSWKFVKSNFGQYSGWIESFYNCGVYVLMRIDHLLNGVKPQNAAEYRSKMHESIKRKIALN